MSKRKSNEPTVIKNHMGETGSSVVHRPAFYINIDKVVKILLEKEHLTKSKATSELIEHVKSELNVEERMAKTYISEARKEIRKLLRLKSDKAFAKVITGLELLRLRTLSSGDNKLFLETIKYYAKMYGLEIDEVKQTGEMTMKNIDMSQLTEHGLERIKRGDRIEEVLIDPKSRKSE